jgi:hypothetical protein
VKGDAVGTARKVGRWLWRNKERMLLGVVMVFLCWRAYVVLNPKEEKWPTFRSPQAELPPGAPVPELPDPAAPQVPAVEFSSLLERNPFTANLSRASQSGTEEEERVEARLSVQRIVERPDGTSTAQIRTRTTRSWVTQGDEIDGFTVRAIDPDAGSVTVVSEESGQQTVLTVE